MGRRRKDTSTSDLFEDGGENLPKTTTKTTTKPAKTGKTPSSKSFEQDLWEAADQMRVHMDPAEYKHVVLGLIFLKYLSDRFYEHKTKLEQTPGALPDERDEYAADNVFWVPTEARWEGIQANSRQPDIGNRIDAAMVAIERENPVRLKGKLTKDYGRPTLDKTVLGGVVDLVSNIQLAGKNQDLLGKVYEYFLGKFAAAEGKLGGQFYTPSCIVRLLVEMIEPLKGRVYDPCCGSGGMFVSSDRFVLAHGGNLKDLSVYGQESNPTTWRLAAMNLAIRGIEADLGRNYADSFHDDQHKDLKADFILANPPFNISEWGGDRLKEDSRWKFGIPSEGNANYAWLQHMIHHLAPSGMAGIVLANGSMGSNQSNEGNTRQRLIEADLVDCMVALPGQLFSTTQIPACLWFLTRSKTKANQRARSGETLFIDARKLGTLIDRTQRELTDADIQTIADTYHAWRGSNPHRVEHAGEGNEIQAKPGSLKSNIYADIAGFCKSATVKEIETHGFVLTPGRYVGAAAVEDDGVAFEDKMKRLVGELNQQFAESAKLEAAIKTNLQGLGFGIKLTEENAHDGP